MSLLTKEQEETLEQSRQRHEQWRGDCDAHTAEVLALVDIIDDLQARAPKQYTEQEVLDLAAAFKKSFVKNYPGEISQGEINLLGVVLFESAKFLGALKESNGN